MLRRPATTRPAARPTIRSRFSRRSLCSTATTTTTSPSPPLRAAISRRTGTSTTARSCTAPTRRRRAGEATGPTRRHPVPAIEAPAKAKLKGKVPVAVSASEECSIEVAAKLRFEDGGKGKRGRNGVKLTPESAELAAGETARPEDPDSEGRARSRRSGLGRRWRGDADHPGHCHRRRCQQWQGEGEDPPALTEKSG